MIDADGIIILVGVADQYMGWRFKEIKLKPMNSKKNVCVRASTTYVSKPILPPELKPAVETTAMMNGGW